MPGADEAALVREAIRLAAEAAARGDPPFGAILLDPQGDVVARGSNHQVSERDPTAHGEVEVVRAAARDGHRPPLAGYTIVINAEPCSMCASLLVKVGISRIVFGAAHEPHMDPDLGLDAVLARSHRPPDVSGGILADEAAAQIATSRARGPSPD